jgi:hypothetical protein
MNEKIAAAWSALTVGMVLSLPEVSCALGGVPLIPPGTDVDNVNDAGGMKLPGTGLGPLLSPHTRGGKPLVFADPSQIEYPLVLQGAAITAPSSPDIQINDPTLDNIQFLSNYSQDPYPWEFATESETTLAADGLNIIVSYNSSAGVQVVKYQGDPYFAQEFISGYSVSHDGGQTWRSGFISPSQGSIATFGDGVVAKDRAGNFYYASLAQDALGNSSVIVGKSTNHGDTFGTAQTVAVDPGSDKEWLAVGPDPALSSRDNIYVTWTSYSPTYANNSLSTLAFSRSTDGGTSWSPVKTLFAYTDNGVLSSYVQFSNPTVDTSNGRLYVPFLHLGHGNPVAGNPNYIRLLTSDDGGNTFTPLAFNVAGAPDPFTYPSVPPGIMADCGKGGGIRLVIKQGPNIGGGWWGKQLGLPRYVHCSRIPATPTAAAQDGGVVIVFEAATGSKGGDPANQSQIMALYSNNGGSSWYPPFVVAAATTNDPQHFLPAVALTPDASTLYVGYYVQQSDEKVRTDLATIQISDSGLQLQSRQGLSSVAFDLEPNNVPSPLNNWDTINFDQLLTAGYALGEYMGVATDANGNPIAAWGDCRNSWVSPANGFFPGAHPQTDVFFVRP